jgi:hypothetical protein
VAGSPPLPGAAPSPAASAGAPPTQAPPAAAGQAPAPAGKPPHRLDIPPGVKGSERRRIERWYSKLSEKDKAWYDRYLSKVDPQDRAKALRLASKIDDRNVADPAERRKLREQVLDQAMDNLSSRDARRIGKILLTDEDPARRQAALEAGGFTSDKNRDHDHDLARDSALYNTENNTLLFSTSLNRMSRGERNEVFTHELAHAHADTRLSENAGESQGKHLAFGLGLDSAWRAVVRNPEERRQAREDLTRFYKDQGFSPQEARAKARHALEDKGEFYASYKSMWLNGDEKEKERLRQQYPEVAEFLRRDTSGSLPTDEQFFRDARRMSLRELGEKYDIPYKDLKKYEGWQNDPAKERRFMRAMYRRAGVEDEYASGVQQAGTPANRFHNGGDEDRDTPARGSEAAPGLGPVESKPPVGSTPPVGGGGGNPDTGAGAPPAPAPAGTSEARAAGVTAPQPSGSGSTYGSTYSSSYATSGYTSPGYTTSPSYPSPGYTSPGYTSPGEVGFGSPADALHATSRVDSFLQSFQGTLDLNMDGVVNSSDDALLQQLVKTDPSLLQRGGDPGQILAQVLQKAGATQAQVTPGAQPGGAVLPPGPMPGGGQSAPPGGGLNPGSAGAGPTLEAAFGPAVKTGEPAGLPVVPTGLGPPEGAPRPAGPTEQFSPQRIRDFKQAYGLLAEFSAGKGTQGHAYAMLEMTRKPQGALAVADALETTVVSEGGAQKLMSAMGSIAANPASTRAFSATLARVAEAVPERAVGIMLLTTDRPGGTEAVSRLFSRMAEDPRSAQNLADFLARSSSTPGGARGTAELLEILTEPQTTGWERAGQTARTLSLISEGPQAARQLSQALLNTMETDGGARGLARMLDRMSRTAEGRQSTADLLVNLASVDRETGGAVASMLARATRSRAGAAQVLGALNRVAASEEGRLGVARLLDCIAHAPQSSRLLANLVRDEGNARRLASLFDSLDASEMARVEARSAVKAITSNRLGRPDAEVFKGRLASHPILNQSLARLQESFRPNRPVVLHELAPLGVSGGGAAAMAETEKLYASAHQIPLAEAPPTDEAWAPLTSTTTRITSALPPTPAASAPAGETQAAPSTPTAQASAAESQALPAAVTASKPALTSAQIAETPEGKLLSLSPAAASSDSSREGSSQGDSQEAAIDGAGEPTALRARPGRPEGGERRYGEPADRLREGLQSWSQNWQTLMVEPSEDWKRQARPEAGSESPPQGSDSHRLYGFRPGDVYSEDTLRQVRICPECGWRTNSAGRCARCEASLRH